MTGENIVSLLAGAIVLCAVAFLFGAPPVHAGECQNMVASHYGKESGNRTASGSYFDGSQMVAAHNTMKFGTKLKVTYQGRSVVVVVADRGPFIRGRELDLSTAAAEKIGLTNVGVGEVRVCRVS